MSWDITPSNIRFFFKQTHGPIVGFLACYLLTLLIQMTGFGIAIVIAGIIAGFLVKNNLRAILLTFAAGFIAWLTLFGIMFAFNPSAFITSWLILSQQMPGPQLFACLVGGIITGAGGQLGSLFAEIAFPVTDDLGLPPGPTERVPTEELPRRKRVKRKKTKKKKKSYEP